MRTTTIMLVAASLVMSLGATAAASRKLGRPLGVTNSIEYQLPEGFGDGVRTLGFAAWVNIDVVIGTGQQEILNHQGAGPTGTGFRLYLDQGAGQNGDERFVFEYSGHLIETGELVTMTVDSGPASIELDRWYHLAVDLRLSTTQGAETRLFVDGVQADSDLRMIRFQSLELAAGNPPLFVGKDRFESGDSQLIGQVQDVGMIFTLWATPLLAAAHDEFLADVFRLLPAVLRFNAPMVRDSDEDVLPLHGQEFGSSSILRGMGPPLRSRNQRPTVIVIGDSQDLDSLGGGSAVCDVDDLDTAAESVQLGRFISDYASTLRTAAVFHVGDWVQCGGPNNPEIYQARAMVNQFKDDGIPWACTVGNHDYTDTSCSGLPPTRNVSYWSRESECTMPTSLFDREPWYLFHIGGLSRAPVRRDHRYTYAFEFEIDGAKEIGIALPYQPTRAMAEFVAAVAARFPTRRIWVSTHLWLRGSGTRSQSAGAFPEDPGPPGLSPIQLWEQELKDVPNLAFIFSGHNAGRRITTEDRSGVGLGPVHQMLHGHPSCGAPGFFGGMYLIEVSRDAGKVFVEAYSVLADEFFPVTCAGDQPRAVIPLP